MSNIQQEILNDEMQTKYFDIQNFLLDIQYFLPQPVHTLDQFFIFINTPYRHQYKNRYG